MSAKSPLTTDTFSRSDYYKNQTQISGQTSVDALSYALRKDLASGKIIRIGRNQYSFSGAKRIYAPIYSDQAQQVANEIKREYPEADFRIFELSQLNIFVDHQIAHNTMFVSVENLLVDYVFDTLRLTHPGKILIKPHIDEYYRYFTDNMIVISRLPSESPKGFNKPWECRLEKTLVDICTDKLLLHIIAESEYNTIFEKALFHYYININAMFRYAKRKGASEKFTYALKNYAPYILEVHNDKKRKL